MGLGSNSTTQRTYLSVGFGKIRQKQTNNKTKVDSQTPNAVMRKTQSGEESWALEHDFVTGVIEKIFYKEDEKYGNSFEVLIGDAIDNYSLGFTEDSRFWFDFMKKLPNIELSKEVKITIYDFEDKKTGKRRAGVSVEQNDVKILSYYDKKNDKGEWELLHGYPSGKDIDFKDKDEVKMYFIKVKKYLRNQFNELFGTKWANDNPAYIPAHGGNAAPDNNISVEDTPEDDLPF
jgi:hypothetical protein